MKKYYLHTGTEQQGPFDLEELKSKNIIRATPIWYEGLSEWITAEKVDELKELFSAIPPPYITSTPPQFSKTKESNTPPPFTEINTSEYMNEFPEEPQKKKWIFWTIGIAAVLLIAFLIFQNKSAKEKVDVIIQQTEATQNNVDSMQAAQKQLIDKNDPDYQALVASAKQEKENQNKAAELEEKMKNLRNNWSYYISTTRNEYTYREIGGIYDLKITVTNDTEYEINEVVVNVDIIKGNGVILKTEQLTFYNILPRSSKTLSSPDNNRGKSINYHFEKIYSKELNFCYTPYMDAMVGGAAAEDLYKCDAPWNNL